MGVALFIKNTVLFIQNMITFYASNDESNCTLLGVDEDHAPEIGELTPVLVPNHDASPRRFVSTVSSLRV